MDELTQECHVEQCDYLYRCEFEDGGVVVDVFEYFDCSGGDAVHR